MKINLKIEKIEKLEKIERNLSMTLRCDIFNDENNKTIDTLKGKMIFFSSVKKKEEEEDTQIVVETHIALSPSAGDDDDILIDQLITHTFIGVCHMMCASNKFSDKHILQLKEITDYLNSISGYENKFEALYQNKLN